MDALTKDQLTAMLQRHTPKADIMTAYEVTEEELDAFCQQHFRKYYDELERVCQAYGRITLRALQWAHGSASLLRFLGEQHLGQRNKIEVTTVGGATGVIRGPVPDYEELIILREQAKNQGTEKP